MTRSAHIFRYNMIHSCIFIRKIFEYKDNLRDYVVLPQIYYALSHFMLSPKWCWSRSLTSSCEAAF